MKKTIIGMIIFFFMSYSISAHAQKCQVLRVSFELGWMPMVFIDEETQKLTGIAYDFFKIIENKLDIALEITTSIPWKRMLYYLEKGEHIDMTAAIYWTEERNKKFVYTDPYFVNESRVFVLKGHEFKFEKFEDLLGIVEKYIQ